jgi:hypothetical protein
MSDLNRRLARLEGRLESEDDGPSDAQRLRDALDRRGLYRRAPRLCPAASRGGQAPHPILRCLVFKRSPGITLWMILTPRLAAPWLHDRP